ncbi:hypothetical protein ACROYT_G026012 [Oculina patagonica]
MTQRLSSNAITFLPDNVFANLTSLTNLRLSSNAITFLPDNVFANLTSLRFLTYPLANNSSERCARTHRLSIRLKKMKNG